MADDSHDASNSFVRQRRDLFVISAILLIGQLAGFHPTKLSFFGTDIEIERVEMLIYAAWTLWAYWLLRYWQAYRELPNGFWDAYLDRRVALAVHWMRPRVEAMTAEALSNDNKIGTPSTSVSVREVGRAPDGHVFIWWTPVYHVPGEAPIPNDSSGTGLLPRRCVHLTRRESLVLIAKSITTVCVDRTAFTDYVLPFVFAASPVVVYFMMPAMSTPTLLNAPY